MVPRRRVAGPHPPPPHCPSQASRPSKKSHVIRVTPTPSQASRLGKRGAVGGINPQHMELQDRQMRMMGMMLRTMTLMCYCQRGCWWYLCSYVALGFGTACSLLYVVENRALSFQAKFRFGSLTVSLSTSLNDFHAGLLSKGPEESADGDHDNHLVIIITIIFITIMGFGAQRRSEFSEIVSHPKVQTLSNRTPNQQ